MTIIVHTPGQKIKSSDETANLAGLADGSNDLQSNSLSYFRRKANGSFVISGLTLPSSSANLSITISLGEAVVNGKYVQPITTIFTVTASKDQYIDLKDDGTYAALAALSVTTGAAAPALTLNSDGSNAFRVGKIVAGASTITSTLQTGVDSLFNAILSKSPLNLISSIFAQSVQSQTNSGTAGGTISYINLGGIKLMWGTTAAQTSSAAGVNYTITPPSGFFSSIQSVTPAAANMVSLANQFIDVSSFSTSSIGMYFCSPSGAASTGASFIVIGT
jgi:hypothetical protein